MSPLSFSCYSDQHSHFRSLHLRTWLFVSFRSKIKFFISRCYVDTTAVLICMLTQSCAVSLMSVYKYFLSAIFECASQFLEAVMQLFCSFPTWTFVYFVRLVHTFKRCIIYFMSSTYRVYFILLRKFHIYYVFVSSH